MNMNNVKEKKEKKDEQPFQVKFLLKTRTILLTGEINDKSAKNVIEQLLILEDDNAKKPITIVLNSGGGSVTSGFAIYDMIRFIKPEVRMVCNGLTASIATVILVAAPKEHRYSLPNTRLLIHQPLIPMEVYGPASDLEITAQQIMKTRERINKLIANETGQKLEKVEADTERDFWLDAEEALEYGLITKIISSCNEIPK